MLMDRNTYVLPTLPTLGGSGYKFTDPTFGSRMLRVTSTATLADNPNSSYGPPSAAHQLAWGANSARFYVLGNFGKCMPFDFDASAMTASRISGTGDGGLQVFAVASEPQFSWVDPDIIYISVQSSDGHDQPVIQKFSFITKTYTTLLALGTTASFPDHTFTGSLFSSQTLEKIATIYGAGSQDAHYLCCVFEVATPTNRKVVDTVASTISTNGGAPVATNITLGFHLHHCQIDRSGRYVSLESTGTDIGLGKAPKYIWDTQTDIITAMTNKPAAHTVMGFGNFINADCCTSTDYDALQFQYRDLSNIAVTRDVVRDVLRPQETYLDGHYSWNCAQNGILVPFAGETYRNFDGPNDVSPKNTTPWRACDNEIITIQTDAGLGPTTQIWRHCHHRSNIRVDNDAAGQSQFWYQPRCNISPDGKWALFASNWERTLGTEVSTGIFRQDAFIVEISQTVTQDPTRRGGFF